LRQHCCSTFRIAAAATGTAITPRADGMLLAAGTLAAIKLVVVDADAFPPRLAGSSGAQCCLG